MIQRSFCRPVKISKYKYHSNFLKSVRNTKKISKRRNKLRILRLAIALFMVVSISACVNMPKPLYDWGKYENSLYKYYKKPARAQKHADVLQDIIDAEADGKRVPPGLRAELGFMLLESGENNAAMELFQKEKEEWPESTVLMDRLIESAGN